LFIKSLTEAFSDLKTIKSSPRSPSPPPGTNRDELVPQGNLNEFDYSSYPSVRRERCEHDLCFDDDVTRKKGKTEDSYNDYAEMWSDFERMAHSTYKRNQYIVREEGGKKQKQIPWVREEIRKLEKSKNVKEELAELQTQKVELEKQNPKTTFGWLELEIRQKTRESEKLDPDQVDKTIANYKNFELEQINLWTKMESLMDEIAKNQYVASRFKSFVVMSQDLYKNGLYDLIKD